MTTNHRHVASTHRAALQRKIAWRMRAHRECIRELERENRLLRAKVARLEAPVIQEECNV